MLLVHASFSEEETNFTGEWHRVIKAPVPGITLLKHILWQNQEYFSTYFCGEDNLPGLPVSTVLLREEIYWWVGNRDPDECFSMPKVAPCSPGQSCYAM